MKKWLLMLGGLGILAVLGVWMLHVPPVPAPTTSNAGPTGIPPVAAPAGIEAATSNPSDLQPVPVTIVTSSGKDSNSPAVAPVRKTFPLPPPLPAPSTLPLSDIPPAILLENMRTTLRQYGLMFGGNPVGTNPELTKALGGDNPKQVNFLGTDGNRVNEKGELCDAWGTPYFFHQLSAMQMEIRSAGPDRIFYTDDDLVIK